MNLGLFAHHWEDRGALRDGDQAHCHARDRTGGPLDLWLYNDVIVDTLSMHRER